MKRAASFPTGVQWCMKKGWGQATGFNQCSSFLWCFDTVGWVTGGYLACKNLCRLFLWLSPGTRGGRKPRGLANTVSPSNTHTHPFYGPFSGTIEVSRCQKKASSGLLWCKGRWQIRHTNHLAGRHSIQTNQRPTSIIPHILCRMPFMPQPCHFILAWDRLLKWKWW